MSETFGTNEAGEPVESCPQKQGPVYWIEIELVDENGDPVPWQEYRLTTSDGKTTLTGYLDETGWSRVDGLTQGGDCKVTFPSLDQDFWQFVESLPARDGQEES